MPEALSIGELAKRTSVPISTLRWWEHQQVLPAPDRVSGRRRYDRTAVRRVALIRMCQRAGFTLGEIRDLTTGTTDERSTQQWQSLASRKLPELDALIDELLDLRNAVRNCLECGCMSFDRCALLTDAPSAQPRSHQP